MRCATRTLRDFASIVDAQTVIVTILAVASTFVCQYFGFQADIPTGLIGLAVVFPIVFSINAAYRRREEALKCFAGIKAHAVAIYYVHRDWVPKGNSKSEDAGRARGLVEGLLEAIRTDLGHGGRNNESLSDAYRAFSKLSASLETLRQHKTSNSEISRANQYISKMMVDFEKMRNISGYRTPLSLRAYSRVFLNFFPIAFGPYFAMLGSKSETFPLVGYMVAILYSLVLVSLDNVQEDLEDPYDQVGADDVKLDVEGDYRPVIGA